MKKFVLGLLIFCSVNSVFAQEMLTPVVIPFEEPIYVNNAKMEDITRDNFAKEQTSTPEVIDETDVFIEEEIKPEALAVPPDEGESYEDDPIELDLSSQNLENKNTAAKVGNPLIIVNAPDTLTENNYKNSDYNLKTCLLVKNEGYEKHSDSLYNQTISSDIQEYYHAGMDTDNDGKIFKFSGGKNAYFKLGLSKIFRF